MDNIFDEAENIANNAMKIQALEHKIEILKCIIKHQDILLTGNCQIMESVNKVLSEIKLSATQEQEIMQWSLLPTQMNLARDQLNAAIDELKALEN